MLGHNNNTHINSLRICSQHALAQSMIRTVYRRIMSSELELAALAPSALLFINKVRLQSSPDQNQQRQLAYNIRKQLNSSYAQAVQPYKGFLPATAEVVLFRDNAEMLACLFLDLLQGDQHKHWWWKTVLADLPTAVLNDSSQFLKYHMRELPAILAYLRDWGQDERFIASVNQEQTTTLLIALKSSFNLADHLLPAAMLEQHSIHYLQLPIAQIRLYDMLPWSGWGQHHAHWQLTIAKDCLLGLLSAIHEAPSQLRSIAYAHVSQQWWRQVEVQYAISMGASINKQNTGNISPEISLVNDSKISNTLLSEAGPKSKPVVSAKKPQTESKTPGLAQLDTNTQPEIPKSFNIPDSMTEADHKSVSETNSIVLARQKHMRTDFSPAEAKTGISTAKSTAILNQALGTGSAEYEKEAAVQESANHVEFDMNAGLHTQLGGIFYLVNLMQFLALPECFQAQCQLSQQLPGWVMLQFLALGLLGDDVEAYSDDPVWAFLRQLEVRDEKQLLGAGFDFNQIYHIPVVWFEDLQTAQNRYYWYQQQACLTLYADAGYVLYQAPLVKKNTVQAQLQSACERYFSSLPELSCADQAPDLLTAAPKVLTAWVDPVLLQWCTLMLPAVRLRLSQAINQGEDKHCIKQLLLCPATLHTSRTHIDMLTKLEHISLPARLAGLDRNPGWLPEMGRVLSFYYQ